MSDKDKKQSLAEKGLDEFARGLENGKKLRRPCSYPGANLAKGWIEDDELVEAKASADRELFRVLNDAVTNWSRIFLYYVVQEFARKWAGLASLEETRAMVTYLRDYEP